MENNEEKKDGVAANDQNSAQVQADEKVLLDELKKLIEELELKKSTDKD